MCTLREDQTNLVNLFVVYVEYAIIYLIQQELIEYQLCSWTCSRCYVIFVQFPYLEPNCLQGLHKPFGYGVPWYRNICMEPCSALQWVRLREMQTHNREAQLQ